MVAKLSSAHLLLQRIADHLQEPKPRKPSQGQRCTSKSPIPSQMVYRKCFVERQKDSHHATKTTNHVYTEHRISSNHHREQNPNKTRHEKHTAMHHVYTPIANCGAFQERPLGGLGVPPAPPSPGGDMKLGDVAGGDINRGGDVNPPAGS